MRQAKKKQMAEELTDFNEKTKDQSSLYDELKRMDEQKKAPSDTAEMEKRRAILKKVKTQIETDDAFKPKSQVEKPATTEAVKDMKTMESKPVAKSGGFLDDLTSFKVE